MKDQLEKRFPIPRIRPAKESSFDTKTKAVNHWLSQLPMANAARATEIIISAIEQVNSHDFALHERLHFLDGLREKVSAISSSLRQGYLRRELPLGQRAEGIALLDYRLMVGMALGYRIALAQTPERGIKGLLSRSTAGRLPNCILGYFASALLVVEECALNYPQGLWSRIHGLYQFAAQRKLSRIATTPCGRMGDATAEATYKGVLLLALSGVHQFPRLEADQVVAAISRSGREASLRAAESGESAILVDLEGDRPPVHSTRRQIRGEQLLALDTCAVLAGMNHRPASDAELSTYTVARLRNRWSPAPDRVHPRLPAQKQIRILPGLTPVHRYLAAVSEPAEPRVVRAAQAAADSLALTSPGEETAEIISLTGSNAPYRTTAVSELHIQALPANTWSRYAEEIVEPATYATVDRSPGGYRVRFESDTKLPLKLGDIVAAQECGDASEEIGRWPIGIIRWVSSQGEHRECGIQLISPYAVPVRVRRREPAEQHLYVEGLILPCPSSHRSMCTILLPEPHLKEGDALEILYGQNVQNISLGPVQDHGHGFTAYGFTDVA